MMAFYSFAIGLSLVASGDTIRTRWTLTEYLALIESANPDLAAAREPVVGPPRESRLPLPRR
jgi:hypothetical protein